MAYTKITVESGEVIESSWGNHIQTQYDEAVSYADGLDKNDIGLGNVLNEEQALKVDFDDHVDISATNSHVASNIAVEDPDDNFTADNVEDALEELFTYVSSGKDQLETAITDMGGTVSKDDDVATFDELDDGIRSIETGVDYPDSLFVYDSTAIPQEDRETYLYEYSLDSGTFDDGYIKFRGEDEDYNLYYGHLLIHDGQISVEENPDNFFTIDFTSDSFSIGYDGAVEGNVWFLLNFS